MTQSTRRMHGRRAIEALWHATRRLRRKTVLVAILVSTFGVIVVSLLLELRSRNGDLAIIAAVLLVLLLLVKPVRLLDRLLQRYESAATPNVDGSAAGDRTRPEPANESLPEIATSRRDQQPED